MVTLQQRTCGLQEPAGFLPLFPRSVAEQAERRLRNNPYLALRNISCEYREGLLILRGHLPTYYLKQVAQAAVMDLAGVERIENRIEVTAPVRMR